MELIKKNKAENTNETSETNADKSKVNKSQCLSIKKATPRKSRANPPSLT